MNDKIKVYVDTGVNLKELKKLRKKYNLELAHVDHYEQSPKYPEPINGVFVLDRSCLDGGDFLAKEPLPSKIKQIVRNHGNSIDAAHIYSAYINKCQYFITNNPKDFIYGGRKDELEQLMPSLQIVTIEELAEKLSTLQTLLLTLLNACRHSPANPHDIISLKKGIKP